MKQLAHLMLLSAMFLVAAETSAQPTKQSPHRQANPVALSDMKWTEGFWHQRYESCRDDMVPAMWEIMRGEEYKPFLEHFRIAAGLSEGGYHGARWNDGDFYKWMEAVCALQAVNYSAEWDARLDEIIRVIGLAQREDGYIHTPVLIANRNGDMETQPFSDRFNFEMYNMGHLMTAACLHHQVTGKTEFLAIARKAADFLDRAFENPEAERARHAICPSHYMGILDLYRATDEQRYLRLAERLIQMRDLVVDGGDDNQDRVPFAQQNEAVGHAVRATYLYAGVTDLYGETGDAALWPPLQDIWKNLVEEKMYITGGCGALFDGASPDGSRNQGSITRIHQAFGRNYQLPNVTAHNETCANIGNVLWNWRMFLVTGASKYIDVMELALYNSVLSGVSLDGTKYFYTNPLRHWNTSPVDLRWSRSRVPFMTSFCCPPNVVRTVAEVSGYAYSVSDKTVWVNLYGGSELDTTLPDGSPIKMKQETNYPWEGNVRLSIIACDADPFTLKLRIPSWAEGADILIDGKPADVQALAGDYAVLEGTWRAGMIIDLEMPMPAKLIESNPLVEETRNEVAVKRGPIVYCLESLDLPAGSSMADIRIPAGIELAPRFDATLLEGVATLDGTVLARPSGNWENKLFRELNRADAEELQASFIPYYAWANRGPAEMSVWLPLD